MKKIRTVHMRSSAGGSISLFLALMLTLILSFLFTLLETARVRSLSILAERNLLLSLESAFGEYNVPMWQNYRMLFLDGGLAMKESDLSLLEESILEDAYLEQKGTSFYHMALQNPEITEYGLATDNKGTAFWIQACKAAKEQLISGAAESLQGKVEKGEQLSQEKSDMEQKWNSAHDAIDQAKQIEENASEEDSNETGETTSSDTVTTGNETESSASGTAETDLPSNPMEEVKTMKKSAILAMVVEDTSKVSAKTIVEEDCMENRKKLAGTMAQPDRTAFEKIWFLQYLNHYFSCQTGQGKAGGKSHALDYELEYCIGGEASDYENLEQVVKELLLIREAGNFATIMQDSGKKALALEIATAAVGFTGLAPLIEAVKIGILLSWSYIESIQDVHCLLSGGKVSLVKKTSEWKTDVSLGTGTLEEKAGKKEDEGGLDYREYLLILLVLVNEDTLVYRAMDIVEKNVRMLPGAESFCMDHQIYSVIADGLYTSEPLFLGFVSVGRKVDGIYHFNVRKQMSYL